MYSFITPITRRRIMGPLAKPLHAPQDPELSTTITRTRSSISTSILATCKPVHKEATPYMANGLRQVEQSTVRIWMHTNVLSKEASDPVTYPSLSAMIERRCGGLLRYKTSLTVLTYHIDIVLTSSDPLMRLLTTDVSGNLYRIALSFRAVCRIWCPGPLR